MILQLLDVLIGLTLVYLILSTAASIGAELLETCLRQRGRLLERGIGQILAQTIDAAGEDRDRAAQELVAILYNSPFVYSLYEGRYEPGGRRLPSAIPAARFAGALIALSDQEPRFRQVADTMLKVAGLSLDDRHDARHEARIREALAGYFEESMQRVSGWYRRHVRLVLLAIGATFAVALNADTLNIVRSLSQDDALRARVVESAIGVQAQAPAGGGVAAPPLCQDLKASGCREQLGRQLALVQSLGLPLGWTELGLPACLPPLGDAAGSSPAACSEREAFLSGLLFIVAKVFGLLLTALATTLGAPFWFDLLNRLVQTRGMVGQAKAVLSGAEPAAPTPAPAKAAAAPSANPASTPAAANDDGNSDPDPGPTPPRPPRAPRRRRSTPRPPRNPTPAA